MERYFEWVTRHRGWVIGAAVVLVSASAFAAADVSVDYSVEQFFPTWGPERGVFDEYRSVFAEEDAQVAFFLETPDGRLRPEDYDAMSAVAADFEGAGLEDVMWLGDLPGVAEASSDASALTDVVRQLAQDPLLSGLFWSPDRTVQVVQGVLPPELNNDRDRRALAEHLDRAISELGLRARWTLSGTPMIRAQVPELLEFDQTVLLGGGIVLFFVILFLFFGDAGRVLLALGSVVPAYLVTLALMAVSGHSVTILTSFIPIVILVVGVCDSTHLLAHWARHRRHGRSPRQASVATFTELATSCFFTSLTTAIGFASLMATGIDVIADFGLFTAMAVMITLAFTMTLLPVFLSLGRARRSTEVRRRLVERGLDAVVGVAVRAASGSPWRVIATFAVVTVVSVVAGSRVGIDTYLVDDLKDDTRIIQDLRWIEASGFGLFQTNVFIRADSSELRRPAMLSWMERIQRATEEEPIVVSTLGLPDLAGDRVLPRSAVNSLVRPESGAAQIVIVVRDAGSRETLPFLERLDALLASDPPPFGTADVTGTVRMAHMFSFHVLRSFGPSILLSLVLIWLVMTWLFGSVRLGLFALVPNVFPLAALTGVMALLGVSLKPSSILVFSIAFGIAVDDSIHLMARFRHLARGGMERGASVLRALQESGRALVMSTLVVSAGFTLLLASRFELLFLVGLLTAVTALTALAADLFLFPALLRVAGAKRSRAETPAGQGIEPSAVGSA